MIKNVVMAVLMIAFTLPAYGAMPFPDKSGDEVLQSMINETLPKFQQLTYKEKNLELPYNLFLPYDYPSDEKYPLLVFIADASVVGKDTEAPLRQGYGGIIWATDEWQAKHKCIVAVPQYPEIIIDDHGSYTITDYVKHTENFIQSLITGFKVDPDRVYVTGQSMGCMTFLVLAAQCQDLFAAELFVSGQWDVKELDGLKSQKFFYVTAEGDQKASTGQKDLIQMFEENQVPFTTATEWDAKMSQENYTKAINTILTNNTNANFVKFRLGTVLPEELKPGVPEHMFSFDYAYKIDSLREWLFRQNRKQQYNGSEE
ncbi:MAG: prolyl oligopeptidase family serine peptidase [Synergistaceae bacterium]|nr:prolyl oligopeptidase family serine peptidase [Synergistaceae bacterium]